MDTLLLIFSKLKEIALIPWFAIADTQISLLSIGGLMIMRHTEPVLTVALRT